MVQRLCVRGVLSAACAALLLGLGVPSSYSADEKKGDDAPAKPDPVVKDIENIGLAYQLAEYGRKNPVPEALVTAAIILRKIGTLPLTEKPTTEVDKGAPKADKEKPPAEEAVSLIAESDKLLAEARTKAKDDKLLLDLIERISKEKGRPGIVVSGPRVAKGVVVAGRRQLWVPRVYRARELVTASVVGDGRNVLVAQVVDEGGAVVSETVGLSPTISYVPRVAGKYTVRVLTRIPNVRVPYTIYAR